MEYEGKDMTEESIIGEIKVRLADMKKAGTDIEKGFRALDKINRDDDRLDAADACLDLEGWMGEIRGQLKRLHASGGTSLRKHYPGFGEVMTRGGGGR